MKKILSVKTFMIAFSFFAISAAAHAAKFDSYVNITNNSSHDMKISDRWSDDKTDVNISKTTLAPGETSSVTINSNHTLKIHRFDLLVDWQNYRGNAVEDNLQLQTDATLFAGKVSVFPREGTSSFNKNYITGDTKITDSDHHNSISFMIGDNNIAPAQYTLTSTVATGNGTVNPDGTTSLWSGDNQIITAAPAADYHLAGWDINGETVQAAGNQYTVSNILGNTVLKAYFEHNDLVVTADTSEGGTISQSGNINIAYGKSLTLTATPDKGYNFTGWTVDGADMGDNTTLTLSDIEKNESVTATFTKQNFVVSVSSTEGGSVDQSGDITVTYGDDLTLTATAQQNYKLINWIVDGEDQGSDNSITLSDITKTEDVEAVFAVAAPGNLTSTSLNLEGTVSSSHNTFVSICGDNAVASSYDGADEIYKRTDGWQKSNVGCSGQVATKGNYPETYGAAISGDNVVFGISGGRIGLGFLNVSDGIWQENQFLGNPGGIVQSSFDAGLVLDNNEGIVGGPEAFGNSVNEGAAYILTKNDDNTWTATQLPSPSDLVKNDYFGSSASISGNYAVVGASEKTVNGYTDAGAVYVYEKIDGVWKNTEKLVSPSITSYERFGYAVAISGDYIIISAPGSDEQSSGTVYMYHKDSNDSWSSVSAINAPEDVFNFGSKVALDGYNALISGKKSDGYTYDYIYRRLNENSWDNGTVIDLPDHAYSYNGMNIKDDKMILGDHYNVCIYNNMKGNEDGWIKVASSTEEGQVVSFKDSNEDKYFELNSDYGKSALEYDINASLTNNQLTWKMNYPSNENYKIVFKCETAKGIRYVDYTNTCEQDTYNEEFNSNDNSYTINCGMNYKYSSGSWEVVNRDLQADLANVEPGNTISKIDSVVYNGGGLVTLPDFTGVNAI